MTSGAPAGSPGGAPQRFGYREWPAPSSSGGSSSPDLPGDSSIESSRVGGCPQSYEMSDRGASSRASTAPSADQSRPNPVSGARPPSPASSSLGQWPPSPALHFRPLLRSSSSSSLSMTQSTLLLRERYPTSFTAAKDSDNDDNGDDHQ